MPHFFHSHNSAELLSTKYSASEGKKHAPKFNSVRLVKRPREANPSHRVVTATGAEIPISTFLEEGQPPLPSQSKRKRSLTKTNVYKKITRSFFSKTHLTSISRKKKDKEIQEWALLDPISSPDQEEANSHKEDNAERADSSGDENVFHSVRDHQYNRLESSVTNRHSAELSSDVHAGEMRSEQSPNTSESKLLGTQEETFRSPEIYRTIIQSFPTSDTVGHSDTGAEPSVTSDWSTDFDSNTRSPAKHPQDPFQTPSDHRSRTHGSLSSSIYNFNNTKSNAWCPSDPFGTPSGTGSGSNTWPPRNLFQTQSGKSSSYHRLQPLNPFQTPSETSSNSSSSSRLHSSRHLSRIALQNSSGRIIGNTDSHASQISSDRLLDPETISHKTSAEINSSSEDIEKDTMGKAWKKINEVLLTSPKEEALRSEVQDAASGAAFSRLAGGSDTEGFVPKRSRRDWRTEKIITRESMGLGRKDATNQGGKGLKQADSNFFPRWAGRVSQERSVEIILRNRERMAGKLEGWEDKLPWKKPDGAKTDEMQAGEGNSKGVQKRPQSITESPTGYNIQRGVSNNSWTSFRSMF